MAKKIYLNYRKIKKLKELLHEGDVYFSYKKKDDTIRNAHGTLKKSLIPDDEYDAERLEDTPKGCFCYYDITKRDWRTFLKKNLIEIKDKEK